jgi:hypothetical protein
LQKWQSEQVCLGIHAVSENLGQGVDSMILTIFGDGACGESVVAVINFDGGHPTWFQAVLGGRK